MADHCAYIWVGGGVLRVVLGAWRADLGYANMGGALDKSGWKSNKIEAGCGALYISLCMGCAGAFS